MRVADISAMGKVKLVIKGGEVYRDDSRLGANVSRNH